MNAAGEKRQFATLPVDLGDGYTIELRFTPRGIICEWSPDVADINALPEVSRRYEDAISAFIWARCNRQLGSIGPITTVLR